MGTEGIEQICLVVLEGPKAWGTSNKLVRAQQHMVGVGGGGSATLNKFVHMCCKVEEG